MQEFSLTLTNHDLAMRARCLQNSVLQRRKGECENWVYIQAPGISS